MKHEEEENYYKPVIVTYLWSYNYIKYERNGDRNSALSVKEYLKKNCTIFKRHQFVTSKIQAAVANNFISSIDNYEEGVKHSKK